jgi:hypothetical protein
VRGKGLKKLVGRWRFSNSKCFYSVVSSSLEIIVYINVLYILLGPRTFFTICRRLLIRNLSLDSLLRTWHCISLVFKFLSINLYVVSIMYSKLFPVCCFVNYTKQ